ncbi:Uncharacterized protein FKW44_017721, partial [Caligus rogercresseyi]
MTDTKAVNTDTNAVKRRQSQGCKEVCRKCGSAWGSPAKNCFKTSHSLVEI